MFCLYYLPCAICKYNARIMLGEKERIVCWLYNRVPQILPFRPSKWIFVFQQSHHFLPDFWPPCYASFKICNFFSSIIFFTAYKRSYEQWHYLFPFVILLWCFSVLPLLFSSLLSDRPLSKCIFYTQNAFPFSSALFLWTLQCLSSVIVVYAIVSVEQHIYPSTHQ